MRALISQNMKQVKSLMNLGKWVALIPALPQQET